MLDVQIPEWGESLDILLKSASKQQKSMIFIPEFSRHWLLEIKLELFFYPGSKSHSFQHLIGVCSLSEV